MKFWDTSAIVPLVIEQPASRSCRGHRRADPGLVVWTLTHVEAWSGCCREFRAGNLIRDELERVQARLGRLAAKWSEVGDIAAVKLQALRLIQAHGLRAADALQLGAALTYYGPKAQRRPFVCLDQGLADAARREGFNVLVPAPG